MDIRHKYKVVYFIIQMFFIIFLENGKPTQKNRSAQKDTPII